MLLPMPESVKLEDENNFSNFEDTINIEAHKNLEILDEPITFDDNGLRFDFLASHEEWDEEEGQIKKETAAFTTTERVLASMFLDGDSSSDFVREPYLMLRGYIANNAQRHEVNHQAIPEKPIETIEDRMIVARQKAANHISELLLSLR